MFYVACLAVVVLDQASKWWMLHHGSDRPLWGEWLRLTLTENQGAAFGLFQGGRAAFVAIGVAAAGGLLYAHRVLPAGDRRRFWLALILGGNLGNLVDRLRLGHVTDFIDMGIGAARWPVYNLADVAVVAGALGLGALLLHPAPRPAAVEALPVPERPPAADARRAANGENSADAR